MGRTGRRAREVFVFIKKICSKKRMKRKRGRIYITHVISEISLPLNAPLEYYLVDSSTFEGLLKAIDYLVAYSSWLEERLLKLAERHQMLEDEYSQLLGRYYLMRNYVTRLLLREGERDDYSEFEWMARALEHDLTLMQAKANDYQEWSTTRLDFEREIFYLKRRLKQLYKL